MITTHRTIGLEMELVKWLLLAALAIALVMALATALAAVEPMTNPMAEPARLPDDMGLLAKPLAAAPVKPYFPENPPVIELPPAEVVARLWTILDQHRAGCTTDALTGWQQVRLPEETAVWRELAMGAAFLTAGDLKQAAAQFDRARQIAPDHPIVAYYTGILRLEQAAAAVGMPDELLEGNVRLVAVIPPWGPEAKAMLQMMARNELQLAIARAADIRLDERLVTGDPTMEEQIVVPRVGDLLVALGADNFTGKAHHLLFGLELDARELARAEEHLDQAVATGIAPLYGYSDLAEAYLAQHEAAAALRATRKDLAANYPLLWEAGQEMKEAVQRAWEGWDW